MKSAGIIFITICSLTSCSELVHTQLTAPLVTVERDTLSANGTDYILLTATIENQLSTRQSLRFSTTNGELIVLPVSTASKESDSSILINPGTTEIQAILKASLVPDDHVILSASVGALTSMHIIRFRRSCPDEVKTDGLKGRLTRNETTDFNLIFLRDDGRKVSVGTRVDSSVDQDNALEMSATFFSDNAGKAPASIKALDSGQFTVTFTDRSGCGLPAFSRQVKIE